MHNEFCRVLAWHLLVSRALPIGTVLAGPVGSGVCSLGCWASCVGTCARAACHGSVSHGPAPARLTSPSLPSQGCGSMRHRHGVFIPVCVLGAEGKSLACLPVPRVPVTLPHAANQLPQFAQCHIQSSAPSLSLCFHARGCTEQTRSYPMPCHSTATVTDTATHAITNLVTNFCCAGLVPNMV